MNLPHLERKEDIERAISALIEMTALARGDVRTLIAKTKLGRIPVGVMISVEKGRMYEPHVTWFPWSSARNKLECWLRYLSDRRHDGTYLIFSEFEARRFFEQLARYGVLRPIGNVNFSEGTPMKLWQTWMARR